MYTGLRVQGPRTTATRLLHIYKMDETSFSFNMKRSFRIYMKINQDKHLLNTLKPAYCDKQGLNWCANKMSRYSLILKRGNWFSQRLTLFVSVWSRMKIWQHHLPRHNSAWSQNRSEVMTSIFSQIFLICIHRHEMEVNQGMINIWRLAASTSHARLSHRLVHQRYTYTRRQLHSVITHSRNHGNVRKNSTPTFFRWWMAAYLLQYNH